MHRIAERSLAQLRHVDWRMEFNITIRSPFSPYFVLRSKLGFKPAVLSENKKGRNRRRGEQEKERKGGARLRHTRGSRVTFSKTAYLYPSCIQWHIRHFSNITFYAVYWHSLDTVICLGSRNKVDNSIAPISLRVCSRTSPTQKGPYRRRSVDHQSMAPLLCWVPGWSTSHSLF